MLSSSVSQRHRITSPASLAADFAEDQPQIAVITYKARSTVTPAYLASLLNSYIATLTLRSSDKNLLRVPHMSLNLGLPSKAVSVSAPTT